jgi:hypothetical protein
LIVTSESRKVIVMMRSVPSMMNRSFHTNNSVSGFSGGKRLCSYRTIKSLRTSGSPTVYNQLNGPHIRTRAAQRSTNLLFPDQLLAELALLLFNCAKTVSESHLFQLPGLPFERKQIPQIVVIVRIQRKTMEPLEQTTVPWAQGVGRSNRPAPTKPPDDPKDSLDLPSIALDYANGQRPEERGAALPPLV